MLKTSKQWTFGSMIFVTSLGYGATTNNIAGHLGGMSNPSSQVGNVPGNRANADLFFDYHRKNVSPLSTGLEARFTTAAQINDQSLLQYSLQEAYVGGNLTSKDSIKVGRQILPWSTVDETWGFGKVNNRRNFDYFVPGQEGLVGLSYERKSSNGMRYRTFLSGIYVPELNPPLDIDKKDQTIKSRSPWADVPASSTIYEGQAMAIKYDVNYPQINDVIYRYTVGANIGFESEHWVVDNFIMRKPENTLTPDVEINVDFTQKIVNAEITPRFYYHDVYGSTLKYRNQDLEMYVSGIAIRPNEYPDVDERVVYTEIKNQKRREDYVGGGISRSNDLYTLAFNYVARLSPFDRDKDDLAQDPRWNQAINFFARRAIGQNYQVSADAKFDMLTTDRLVMLRATYLATKALVVNFGVNWIGTPNDGKSFWSPYTNNDAVFGGLRYVF